MVTEAPYGWVSEIRPLVSIVGQIEHAPLLLLTTSSCLRPKDGRERAWAEEIARAMMATLRPFMMIGVSGARKGGENVSKDGRGGTEKKKDGRRGCS